MRLFYGLRLPREAVSQLVQWQQAALGGPSSWRVVAPENLHVTVAFLGSRPVEELQALLRLLSESTAALGDMPELTVSRYRETRSVGMLVFADREGRAAALADRVHARLEELRAYRREARPWLPHITVIRFRRAPRLRPRLPDLGPVNPSDLALYHSVLRPTGAQYHVLDSVALGG